MYPPLRVTNRCWQLLSLAARANCYSPRLSREATSTVVVDDERASRQPPLVPGDRDLEEERPQLRVGARAGGMALAPWDPAGAELAVRTGSDRPVNGQA